MEYDCLIIGGGMSGLAAGIRLAHYDKKVCICERHHRLGGLNSFYSRQGIEIETGLHAMTNYARQGADKALPLMKMLRQLRLPYEALSLREQNYSVIKFPDREIRFDNDFKTFEDSVAVGFPAEIERFRRFDLVLRHYEAFNLKSHFVSARKMVASYLHDPLLVEMLFCPLMYYGSAHEDDMDFAQFVIMYKSIFHEGFCRPGGKGIVTLLNLLEQRFLECGGEIRRNCEIRRIRAVDGVAVSVTTGTGEEIGAEKILSSAGLPETLALCAAQAVGSDPVPPGMMAFLEVVAVLPEEKIKDLGFTIMFFNDGAHFDYRRPRELYDRHSGVICLPRNFRFRPEDGGPTPMLRVTAIADPEQWLSLGHDEYQAAKKRVITEILGRAERRLHLSGLEADAELLDAMTPKTIYRYTGRINGAVYGTPRKSRDGTTFLKNLFICGTDQGFLGIAGSMLSGISIANLHLLK